MTDGNQILDASFDFSVVDSNSLMFVFKHAPEVVKELHGNPELSLDTVNQSDSETWKVLSYAFVSLRPDEMWLYFMYFVNYKNINSH